MVSRKRRLQETKMFLKSRAPYFHLQIVLPAVSAITLLVLACDYQQRGEGFPTINSNEPLMDLVKSTCLALEVLVRSSNGIEVAVKVFHSQLELVISTSFDVECEVLCGIRHRNLVKTINSCSNTDFKALVLDYMPNGSVDNSLYSQDCTLNILQRLSIMMVVASSLEYLYFGNSTPMVHCDMKPSNILLDQHMVAHLSDLGIGKFLIGEDSMTQTQTLTAIGYMASEYEREGRVFQLWDHSNGNIYKEKPAKDIFVGDMSLRSWVGDSLSSILMEIVDPFDIN